MDIQSRSNGHLNNTFSRRNQTQAYSPLSTNILFIQTMSKSPHTTLIYTSSSDADISRLTRPIRSEPKKPTFHSTAARSSRSPNLASIAPLSPHSCSDKLPSSCLPEKPGMYRIATYPSLSNVTSNTDMPPRTASIRPPWWTPPPCPTISPRSTRSVRHLHLS